MSLSKIAALWLDRRRLALSKQFNRDFYDRLYYSDWLTGGFDFFNLGLAPADAAFAGAAAFAGERHQAQVYLEAIKAWRRHTDRPVPRRVLEIATGLGGGMQILAHCLPDTPLFGLDYSYRAVQRTRRGNPAAGLIVADARAVPLAAADFDLIVNVESMHAVDIRLFLSEARRLLSGDGHLVVIDFRLGSVQALHRFLLRHAIEAHLHLVEFSDCTERALAAATADTARRRQLQRRVPWPFRHWVNEMTAGEGSELRRRYESGEKTYFLAVFAPAP